MAAGTPFKTFAPHPGAPHVYSSSFYTGLMGTVDRVPSQRVRFTAAEAKVLLNKIWNAKEYSSKLELTMGPSPNATDSGFTLSLSGKFISAYVSTTSAALESYSSFLEKPINPIDAIDGTVQATTYAPSPTFGTFTIPTTLPTFEALLPLLGSSISVTRTYSNAVGGATLVFAGNGDVQVSLVINYIRILDDGGVDLFFSLVGDFAYSPSYPFTTRIYAEPSASSDYSGTIFGKSFSFSLYGYDAVTLDDLPSSVSLNIDMDVSEYWTY